MNALDSEGRIPEPAAVPPAPAGRSWSPEGGRLAWVLVALTSLVCGSVSLVFPFGNDQLYYCFLGDALAHGKVLYRDIPMMQMPLSALLHALALAVFGRQMASIRILDLLWTFATAGTVFLFTWRAFGRRWLAIAAGCLYPFFYHLNGWWFATQPDGFLNLPVAVSFLLMLRPESEPRRPGQALLAGVMIGLALLFKYPMLLVLPGLMLAAWFDRGRDRRDAGRLALGCLVPLVGFVLAILITGGWGQFVQTQVGALGSYTQAGGSALGPLARLGLMIRTYVQGSDQRPVVSLGLPGIVAGIVAAVRSGPGPERRALVLVFIWLGAALGSIYGQGKMMLYHYLPLLPPVAILGAWALTFAAGAFWRRLRPPSLKPVIYLAVLAGTLALTGYRIRFADVAHVVTGRVRLHDMWRETRFSTSGFSVAELLELSDYLEQNTAPTDRLTNFALMPQPCFPVWREPVLNYNRVVGNDPAVWRLNDAYRANPPEVFIVKREDRIPWVRGHSLDSYEQLMAFTELRDLVLDEYEFETRIRNSDVLRRFNSDRRMPAGIHAPERLEADLQAACRILNDLDPGRYATVLWPRAVAADAFGLRIAPDRVFSQRTLNRWLWAGERDLDDLLPMVSVWIRNDDRPFGRQYPMAYQDDGENFISGGLRFRLLEYCPQGTVFVFLVDKVTGEEVIGTDR